MANDKHMNTGALESGVTAREFVLSRDPRKAMEEMMATIDALRTVYVEETDALEKCDTQTFLALQDRKIASANKYQSGIAQILARKDEMRAADPTLRIRLVTMQEDFSNLSARNIEALNRVSRGVKKLGDRIMNSARDAAAKDAVNYGKKGLLNKYKGPVSIGVSEQA
ncbi:MAG: flagellar protein FlgN [Alphaproteobacteria bacterium]|nr:flagellar protein FlgN [Alphaproteobacteria bacterium]MBU0859750.1 flagellar protein FlgN [Alphaproteobacteria bacterium]